MGTNTLETAYSNGQVIDASHINEVTASLTNQFVGRNTSGVPESGKSLGTVALPWGAVHADSVILDGQAVDTGKITSAANRIISGATRADSSQPDFLRADGTAATLTVLGASTNLTLSVNAIATVVSTDIVKTGLTLAPAANNTCLVNDAALVNDLYTGEDGTVITVDNMGSELTARVGQYVGLRTATGEIMYAFVKSVTELTNVFRGFFFDDTGAPLVRGNLSDNDTLTLINLGYIFVEDNGTTVDITYLQPVYGYNSPASPSTGQYWFDISNQTWKRYSGTEFEIIDRILIGIVGLDDTAAIATRAADFTRSFSNVNNVELEIATSEIVQSKTFSSRVNVYGKEVQIDLTKLSWNITTDLETGLVESTSTVYCLYLSEDGQTIISNEKPYYREDLKGDYHPYHSWRMVGMTYNDAGDDLTVIWSEAKTNTFLSSVGSLTTTSATFQQVTDVDLPFLHRGIEHLEFGYVYNNASDHRAGDARTSEKGGGKSQLKLSGVAVGQSAPDGSTNKEEGLSVMNGIIQKQKFGFYTAQYFIAANEGAQDFYRFTNMQISIKEVR